MKELLELIKEGSLIIEVDKHLQYKETPLEYFISIFGTYDKIPVEKEVIEEMEKNNKMISILFYPPKIEGSETLSLTTFHYDFDKAVEKMKEIIKVYMEMY